MTPVCQVQDGRSSLCATSVECTHTKYAFSEWAKAIICGVVGNFVHELAALSARTLHTQQFYASCIIQFHPPSPGFLMIVATRQQLYLLIHPHVPRN